MLTKLKKYMKFIGPGLMVSVAYMDPGNYSTAVSAGANYKYNLLFSILLSNCLAIFLQILSARLGCVTGLDLAANCKVHLNKRVNLGMYIMAEIAIIATDLAEVVGTAIALNILFNLPLVAGVIVTIVDVLIVLMAYKPSGPLVFIRIFEGFVSLLVTGTVVCFAIELYQVSHDSRIDFSYLEVLKGFLPNSKVVEIDNVNDGDGDGGNGLYLSLAILGATVMPHSLYLGSGLVQSRLKDYDLKNDHYSHPEVAPETVLDVNDDTINEKDNDYRPSIHAIHNTMSYTITELVISLFTVALFVNSAILIVAGATLKNGHGNNNHHDLRDDDYDSDTDDDSEADYTNADLFTIYNLLTNHLSHTAGLVFALALLFSGQSAGIVCTLAGQMVSEGFLNWSFPPVTRRLITRALAILPCFVVVLMNGREGLSNVLNLSQVVLSFLLPFVTAPLIMFTCSKEIMRVPIKNRDEGFEIDSYMIDEVTPGMTGQATGPVRYKASEPAIKLQDLRNHHPCGGFDEDEDFRQEESARLLHYTKSSDHPNDDTPQKEVTSSTPESEPLTEDLPVDSEEDHRVVGYKDLSNGPITAFFAVLIWGFITVLNLFLIGSLLMGYDVPI